ncbi:hypothetical protein BDM02DRAFT_3183990 [Thelephora ganbajun]|uniref:Uncharacterized protein n=1 Tax=Thelephora ganbajun TaxID=370292 RepID=A0ACB6ZRB6_THEGA|nr:hypothetical protein BDM02DRAFT_3183990 [Thelephora ganbajun]
MARTAKTSTTAKTSDHLGAAWPRFYAEWCKGRKERGLPCYRKLAGNEWKKLSPDEKAMYRVRRRETPKLPYVTGPSYEDEDSVSVVSLDATPVTRKEQLPASPLFSEFGPFDGPSALDQAPSTGPSSAVIELALPGPSCTNKVSIPEPFSTTDQPSVNILSFVVEEPPVPGPSLIPPSTFIPLHPLPETHFLDDLGFSLLDESAYNHTPSFGSPEINWWRSSSGVALAETNELALPPSVPPTPTTGYSNQGSFTPGYTPGLLTQNLPAELDDNLFVFNDAESAVSGQPLWNVHQDAEYVPQQSLAFPTPAVVGQSGQQVGFPSDPYQWNEIARVLESDQPQVTPPPVYDQNATLSFLQQTLNSVNVDNFGQGSSKPLRMELVGVQFWLAPS